MNSLGGRIERVGVIAHAGRESAVEVARDLIGWLRDRGIATRSLETEQIGADECRDGGTFADGIDLVVSVGGDGTLLRSARHAYSADVPLLGVNVGRLGFLTEAEPGSARDIIDQVLAGHGTLERRMALSAEPIGAPWTEPEWALNEVIVEKTARHRLIKLRAEVSGEELTRFSADGLIVATPTGSTAYSFSARGPIVSPKVACLLLTPVSPHMVFDRAIVLPPDEGVVLEVLPDEPGLLSADGRPGLELPVGSRVLVRRAERPLRLVRREGSASFFSLLREKFWLPGQAPHGGRSQRLT
jgi:NAD+ kinase